MAVSDISTITFGSNSYNLKDPTKYTKPPSGIPASDLTSDVQTSLGKADHIVEVSSTQPTNPNTKIWVKPTTGETVQVPTVAEMNAVLADKYEKPSGGIPDSDIASSAAWNAKGSYSKPSGGIPIIDLAIDVQTSLGKADTALQAHQDISGKIDASQKGAANGIAELDANGKIPSSQLPSYVDDVLEYTDRTYFPATGEANKIYVDTSTNLAYRWGGSAYVEISPSITLGETSGTAFRGDYGAAAYAHGVTNKGTAFASGLYKITTNSEGHVTAASAVQKSDITGLGIASDDATPTQASVNATGLITYKNSSGTALFTLQLPLYNGGNS